MPRAADALILRTIFC